MSTVIAIICQLFRFLFALPRPSVRPVSLPVTVTLITPDIAPASGSASVHSTKVIPQTDKSNLDSIITIVNFGSNTPRLLCVTSDYFGNCLPVSYQYGYFGNFRPRPSHPSSDSISPPIYLYYRIL